MDTELGYEPDEDAGDEALPDPQTGGVRALRQRYEQTQRKLSQMEQEMQDRLREAEERGARAAMRRVQAERTFEGFGLPKLADLWLEKNPEGDVSDDAAAKFLEELGVPPGNAPKAPSPPPVQDIQSAQAFQTAVPTETSTSGYISRKDLDDLYKSNPRQALEYLQSGRVRWENLPND